MKTRETCMAAAAIKTRNNAAKMEVSELMLLRESRHRKNTRGVNHALLQQLTAFFGGPLLLCDLTEDFCVRFTEFLMHQVSPNSVRTYLHKLHALLEYAVCQHLLSRNPIPSIKDLLPRVTTPRRAFLTQDEVHALSRTDCPHPETKRAFLFSCQTGLRLSDIETLTWDDVVDLGGVPTIVKMQVKTGHEVRIPLNEIALKLIGKRVDGERVFSMMSRSVVATDLRRWAADAGISKHLTFHVSRHTFATLSISAGVDIYVVSKLCGHTALRTTEIYAHMVDTTLQRGVALLGVSMRPQESVIKKTGQKKMNHIIKYLFRKKKNRRYGNMVQIGRNYDSTRYEELLI